MFDGFQNILLTIKGFLIYLATALLTTFFLYYFKKKNFFGGFWTALLVALFGAFLGGFVLDYLFYDFMVELLEFLSRGAGVNVLAGFIGAYGFLFLMNKLSKERERSDK